MVSFDPIRSIVGLFGRWDHPILMGLLAFALSLQIIGFIIETVTQPRLLSGFLMVFAMLFAGVALLAYLCVFSFQAFLKLDRKYGLTT